MENLIPEIVAVLSILALLFAKHFIHDFVFQHSIQIVNKGIYGSFKGLTHSLDHGLSTLVVFTFFTSFPLALVLAFVDVVLHYHIDWAKAKLTNDCQPDSTEYWIYFGLDQLLHALTYIGLVALYFIWK